MIGNEKLVQDAVRGQTHMSVNLTKKLRNVDILEIGQSTGLKNRLRDYRKTLAMSRGIAKPGFDDRIADLLREYVWDKRDFEDTLNYLNNLKDDEGFKFSRDLKIYKSCEDALTRFSESDHSSFRWNVNYQKSLEEFKRLFSSIRLSPILYKSDDDIREAIPKDDTHSGFYYLESGRKKKGDNMDGIFEAFTSQLDQVSQTGSFNRPILLGFRTQASGEFDDAGNPTNTCKHKLRVVSMVDLLVIVGELMFAKPIQEAMASLSSYAGGKSSEEISMIITDWRTRWKKFISIDYSSFDQTISSWLIEDAFDVLKCAFKLNSKEEMIWNAVVHDFIHKDFILNEGILHSDKGVPSGSMFTQIIDSLVNLIVVRTYFISIGQENKMMAMGDDNIIFCNEDVEMAQIASYIAKNFGLVVKVDDKSNEGSTHNSPKFLSRYWTTSGQWRDPHHLVSRMLFPERFRPYSSRCNGDLDDQYSNESVVGPEHVIYAFILTYKRGMVDLMDVERFQRDYPRLTRKLVEDKVDSRYLPGALAYIREYTFK